MPNKMNREEEEEKEEVGNKCYHGGWRMQTGGRGREKICR